MDFLDIWEQQDLFDKYDFSALDKKILLIQNYRENNNLYDEILKELNNRVDIDYVKDSEMLEGNELVALKDISFDEDYQDLYDTDIFDKHVKPSAVDEFYLGQYRTIMKNGRLTIYQKNRETGKIRAFKCGMPKHLKALKDTLSIARKEQSLIENGEQIDITPKFIESVHEKMFSDYIFINTRMNKIPGKPPIKPEGYGKFRRTIYINGNEHKYNVEVEGANWQATDSDYVNEEMTKLVELYNKSKFHPIIKAAIFKACIVKIHPFRDGNGRISRMLLNYMLVRNGIPTVTIRGTDKDFYFFALDEAIEKQDYSHLIKLICRELSSRCEQYLSLYKKLELENQTTNNLSEI